MARIEDAEARSDFSRTTEIVDDLNVLETPIAEFFEDVETLKYHRHPEANDFHKQYILKVFSIIFF